MKLSLTLSLIVVFLILFVADYTFAATAPINRIEGMVYDSQRKAVENAVVELLNEVDSIVARTRTNASGRFSFIGNYRGRYIVRVSPFGTNLKAQSKEVTIGNALRNTSDNAYVDDFYLAYEKESAPADRKNAETIFAQDVPPAAQKLFDEAVESFKRDDKQGLAKLEQATAIFPEYFAALNLLGEKYVSLKNYEKAALYSTRAVAVNPRSAIDFYLLAISLYRLKKFSDAVEPAKSAVTLTPGLTETQLLYGTVLRINNQFIDAEKVLLKAGSLAKGKNADVFWQLALLYNRQNRNQEAVTALETFLKINPDNADRKNVEDLIAKLKASVAKAK